MSAKFKNGIDVNSQKITSVADPAASTDATTKNYVDTQDALNAKLASANTFTAANTIAPTSTTAVPLTLKGTSSLGSSLSGLVVTTSNATATATLTATGGSLSATGLQPYTTYAISSSGIPSITKDPTVASGQTGYTAYTFTTRGTISTSTTVGTDPGSSGTTITVASTAGFSYTGTIQIDSEQITYTGLTGTTFTGCTRGANSTTAAAHTAGATVTFAGMPIFLSPTPSGVTAATNAAATVTLSADISDVSDVNNNVLAKFDQTGSLTLNNGLIINRSMYTATWPVVINTESSSFSSSATTYYYTVVPVFSNGDGFVATTNASTTSTASGYVRQTQTTVNNTNTVTLNWVQTAGAIGYKIYRNTSNAFTASGLLLTTITSGSITSYKDTGTSTSGAAPAGVSSMNQYAFAIYDHAGTAAFTVNRAFANTAINNGLQVGQSGSGGAGTLVSPSYALNTQGSSSTAIPLLARSRVDQTLDILRISDQNNSIYASFDNFGNLKNNGTNVYVNALSVPSPSAALASGGSLTVSTQYNYQVTAVNPQGETTVSSTVNVTPTSGNQTASLSWTQIPGASGYKIYRATGASPTWTGAQYIPVSGTQQTTASSTTTNTYNDTGTTPFSSASVSGTTVTLTTSVAHGLYGGQLVSFSGFANNAGTNWTTLNSGSYAVSLNSSTQFTITVSSSTPTSTATLTNAYFAGTAPTAPTGTKLITQAWNGQTGNIQEWQNSSGTALTKVDASGNLTAASIIKTGGTSSQLLKADGSVVNYASPWVTVSEKSGTISAINGFQYILGNNNATVISTATTGAGHTFYLDPADYTVSGFTTNWRLIVTGLTNTNTTISGSTRVVASLYPAVAATTTTAGSTAPSINGLLQYLATNVPAVSATYSLINATSSTYTSTFNGAGLYALTIYAPSGSISGTNFAAQFTVQLQVRYTA